MSRGKFSVVPIQQVDVYATIRARLSDLIDREFEVGDKLPSERALAEALGVSRPALREAMRVLESMGKVQIRHGAGTFVTAERNRCAAALLGDREPDAEFLEHLIELRAAIEVKVAELAVERATEEDVAELHEVLARNEREHLADPELGSLNLLFEAALARITRNPLLISMQQTVHELWVEVWGELSLTPDSKHKLHGEHGEILSALERRDAERVVELMRRHVDRKLSGAGWKPLFRETPSHA